MSNNHLIKKYILSTLCYSDIFDYPLTKSEIYSRYAGESYERKSKISEAIESMVADGVISRSSNYLNINGRKHIVNLRKERSVISKDKTIIAKKTAKFLSKIPTVKFIGISGSLAMGNAREEDDIDLFFITTKNSLWITRFLVNIMLVFIGMKRSKKHSHGTNKICPNMFVSEDAFSIKKDKRNLFSAYEIIQLFPLINKSKAHERFLGANKWVSDFLPNFIIKYHDITDKKMTNSLARILNELLYILQYIYMLRSITNEEISLNSARFHPKDVSHFVLDLHKIKLEEQLLKIRTRYTNSLKISEDTPGY